MRRTIVTLMVGIAASLLLACGGNGSTVTSELDSSKTTLQNKDVENDNEVTSIPTPTPTPTSTPTPTPSPTPIPERKEWEIEVLMNTDETDRQNNYRTIEYGETCIVAHCIIKNMPEDDSFLETYGIWEHPQGTTTYYNGNYEVEVGGDIRFYWSYLMGDQQATLPRGAYTITIYDAKTDNRLGGGSINVQ